MCDLKVWMANKALVFPSHGKNHNAKKCQNQETLKNREMNHTINNAINLIKKLLGLATEDHIST